MANYTISPTGGNFNATTTWVGGVVPTSNDGIIGNSASGNLNINVSSTIKEMRLDGGTGTDFYAGTITLTNNFIIGPTGNFYLSPNMGITGSGLLQLFVAGNWKSYGFYLPCNLSLANTGTRVLLDDFNWQPVVGTIRNLTGNCTIGGTYSFNVWGNVNQALHPATFTNLSGSFNFRSNNGLVDVGNYSFTTGSKVKVDVAPGTFSIGLLGTPAFVSGSSIEYISGGWTGSLWTHNDNGYGIDFSFINIPLIKKFYVFNNNGVVVYRSNVPLNVSRIHIVGPDGDSSVNASIVFHGGLSCSTFYGTVGRNYSAVHTPAIVNVSFASGAVYTINELIIDGGGSTINSRFKSLTASQPATVNLNGPATNNMIISTDITDINFTGTTPVYAIAGSTLTRTTGATTSFASGGAGGGPSSTTFLM